MNWTQSQPDTFPITLKQAKAFLRVDNCAEDDLINDLIAAATSYAENAMARSLIQRTVTATFFAYATPLDLTYLPRGPVISVTSVTDASGRAIANSVLEAAGNFARLRVNNGYSFPVNLTVVYEAGYADECDIPAEIKHAIKMHVSHLYNFREPSSERSLSDVPLGLQDFYALHSFNTGVG